LAGRTLSEVRKSDPKPLKSFSRQQKRTLPTTEPRLNPQNSGKTRAALRRRAPKTM